MTVLKCKMCGGDLEISSDSTIATCEYCGTKQVVPKITDESLQTLYNQANTLRIESEFDRAITIYDQIIRKDKTQADAYWGRILCKYGIEYVDDPKTNKKIPTCHRASYDPIITDEDYKNAVNYSDAQQRSIYEKSAKEIDGIQKEILALAQKEESYDVFICYKESDNYGRRTHDSVEAEKFYTLLTNAGVKVFFSRITLEDKIGEAYEPIIFAALNSAKVMLAIGTKVEYFNSVWVKNEWSRYLKIIAKDPTKHIFPCYKDLDPKNLPEEFVHLQAQDMSKIGFEQDLMRGIGKILGRDLTAVHAPKTNSSKPTDNNVLLERAFILLEDKKIKQAAEICEEVIYSEPKNPYANLLKLMLELKVRRESDLKKCSKPFDDNPCYQRIMQSKDDELKSRLEGYIKYINAKLLIESEKKEEKRKKADANKENRRRRVGSIIKPILIILAILLAISLVVGGVFGIINAVNNSKIEKVEEIISTLPDDNTLYLDYYQEIVEAYGIYQSLNPKLQSKVENANKLLACMEGLEIAEAYEMQQKLKFEEANGGYSVSVKPDEANKLSGNLVIPATYKGKPVTTIPENAFTRCSKITSITVPNSVTNIGKAAFSGCSNISSITLPFVGSSREGINEEGLFGYIFSNTEYTGGTQIKQYYDDSSNYDRSFSYIPGQLNIVTITDATQLSYGAFYNCSMLKEIRLNNNIISVGKDCFYNCSNITQINLPNITTVSDSMLEGCSSLASFNINNSVTTIESQAFKGCTMLSQINSNIEGEFIIANNVQSIGSEAFNGCIKLKSITLPFVGAKKTATGAEGLFGYIFGNTEYTEGTQIKQCYDDSSNYDRSFSYIPNQLSIVTITDAMQLSYGAFYNCSMLKTIFINSEAKNSIGENAFYNCVTPSYN